MLNDEIIQREDGYWWYRTEDEDIIGPWPSYEKALEQLTKYCEWLDQPKL